MSLANLLIIHLSLLARTMNFRSNEAKNIDNSLCLKYHFFSPWLHFRNWVHWKTRILLFYGWDSFRIGGNLLSVLNYASYFPEYKWNKIDESKIMRNNELRKWKTNDEKIWSGNDNKTKWKRQFLNLKFWLFRFSLDENSFYTKKWNRYHFTRILFLISRQLFRQNMTSSDIFTN